MHIKKKLFTGISAVPLRKCTISMIFQNILTLLIIDTMLLLLQIRGGGTATWSTDRVAALTPWPCRSPSPPAVVWTTTPPRVGGQDVNCVQGKETPYTHSCVGELQVRKAWLKASTCTCNSQYTAFRISNYFDIKGKRMICFIFRCE